MGKKLERNLNELVEWEDYVTPVNAANLNAIKNKVISNSEDITALSNVMLNLQTKNDNTLETFNKSVPGAINELKREKFDKVTISNNILKFYANNVEKYSITLPTNQEVDLSEITNSLAAKYDNVEIVGQELKFYVGNVLKKTITLPTGESGSVDLSAYQTKNDSTLTTTDKTVVGAINEIASDTSQNSEKLEEHLAKHPNGSSSTYSYYLKSLPSLAIKQGSGTTLTLKPNTTASLQIVLLSVENDLEITIALTKDGIDIPDRSAIVADMLTQKYAVKATNQIKTTDVVLLVNYLGKPVGGLLHYSISKYYEMEQYPLDTNNYKTIDISGWQDFTFIENKLVIFTSGNDEHTTKGKIYVYNPETMSQEKVLTHNLGHCNCIDYNKITKKLILGNGSSDTTTGIMKGWIINNFDQIIQNETDVNFETIDKIELDFTWLADKYKCNLCWGEPNYGDNNICYLMQNDNRNISRVILGKGSEKLTKGVFVEGKSEDEFNGSYAILLTYELPQYIDVNQGAVLYNSKLYISCGHDGAWMSEISMIDDLKECRAKKFLSRHYKGLRQTPIWSEGVGVDYNNKLWLGFDGDKKGFLILNL